MIEYTTLSDTRLEVYTGLTELQLRNKLEPEKGVFIAESDKVIHRALDAGYVPLSLVVPTHRFERERTLINRIESLDNTIPVFVLPADELKNLAGYELTRGVLCAMRRKPLLSVEEVVRGARRIAVLEDITNHTNVGAAFRSAAALGMDAVLVTPACCDPLYRRAVRVSMGTVFQVPWTRIGAGICVGVDKAAGVGSTASNAPSDGVQRSALSTTLSDAWPTEGLALLSRLGFKTVALALSDDALCLDDPILKEQEKLALVVGTEGDGLFRDTIASCDYVVRIPMAQGVDSLNVAAASAVAFWELRVRS